MSAPNSGQNPTQYLGVKALNPAATVIANRAPSSHDINYELCTIWDYEANSALYMLAKVAANTATWVTLSSGSSGPVQSVAGTANQISASTVAGAVTLSLPSAITAPGSITSTTTISVGTKLNVATGANASVGTSAAMTAGVVTVATSSSSGTAKIFYSRATTGGTPGNVSITAQDGTGFTLTSTSNTETSTFNYWIINA